MSPSGFPALGGPDGRRLPTSRSGFESKRNRQACRDRGFGEVVIRACWHPFLPPSHLGTLPPVHLLSHNRRVSAGQCDQLHRGLTPDPPLLSAGAGEARFGHSVDISRLAIRADS